MVFTRHASLVTRHMESGDIMNPQYVSNPVIKAIQVMERSDAAQSGTRALWPVSREESSLSTKDLTILVVDDEPNIVEVVSAYLKRELFNVVTAYDGEEALKSVAEHNPDLIVLDVMLPRLDGLEV